MRTISKTTHQMVILGMLIALEEREKHHRIMGDDDVATMYKEQQKTLRRFGKLEKKLKDGSWTSDMFAKVYNEMYLHPDDYQEVYDLFFSL